MKFKIQQFAMGVAFVVLTTLSPAADKPQASSAEKARSALAVLQSNSPPADKALACKHLAIYGNSAAVPALAPLLLDKELASWARIALEAIPGPAADAALRDAMKKVQGQLLVGVINSIGVRRDAKAQSVLAAKLEDPNVEVASAAAIALGRIGGDSAAKALQQSLAKAPASTRSAVARGCILCAERFLAEGKSVKAAKLYDTVRQADLPKQRKLEATRGAILARQSEGLPLLLEMLRSTDKQTFQMGLHTARELPGVKITKALAAELEKTSPDRQGPILLALADREDEAVLPAVLATARTGPTQLRLQSVAVLVRLAAPESVPVLFYDLTDSDGELTTAAQSALANWTGDGVDREVVTRLPQAQGNTRRLLVELAGQRHAPAAVTQLTKAANDPDPKLRAAAIKSLGETVSAANLGVLTALLAQAKTADELAEVQAALESACARIPDKEACADNLLASFPASPTPAKCALLRVLGVVGNTKALTAVQSALSSPEPTLSDTAVRVLADWVETPALQPLFEVFCTTTDESHRFLALRGCVRLLEPGSQSAEQTLKMYTELLARTQRSDDRKVILSGLANVADPAALKLVEPLLAEPAVRAEAELAAVKIAENVINTAPAEAAAAAARLQAESKNQGVRDRAAKILAKAK
jgi:HEAT repeat protein